MPISFYEVAWIFLIYAFFGWCTEVAYAALETGTFVNRGFLNGPVCPIYGCGILLVAVVLTPLKENLLILFFGSIALTTLIEFVTGFLLEKIFHNQWWDYSNEHFNLCGYICLKFSILWGLACTFVMDIVHPLIFKIIKEFPHNLGLALLGILLAAFACDFGITVSMILKFNKRLRLMEEVAGKLKEVSDEIGENIYENVTEALERKAEVAAIGQELKAEAHQKHQKFKVEIQKKKEDAIQLCKKYEALLEERSFGHKRLLKAFPSMKSKTYQESLRSLKKHINKK